MSAAALAALAIVGFGVGLLAGLVGIGGGVLIVPFLYFFFGHPAWSGVALPPQLHAAVAHATSLFIIVPTAVVGTITYTRSRMVVWRAVLPIAVFSMIAAWGGAKMAARVPPELLKIAFGLFLLFTATQLVSKRHAQESGPIRVNIGFSIITGICVGVLSALLGVGGGLVAIPLLMGLMRIDLRQVAATSLAIVAFAALSGTLTYMSAAQAAPGLVGYVHLAAALPMLPGAMIAVRFGAKLNQRLDQVRLRRIFAALFVLLGARLVIFNLLALLRG